MLNLWGCHCHYLVAKSCWTLLWPHGLQHVKLHCSWDVSGKNTGVGHHFLFQGVFLIEPISSALAGRFFTTEPPGKLCFIDYIKAFLWLYGSQQTGIFLKRWKYQTTLPVSWETNMQDKKQQLELDMEQRTGSKLGKVYIVTLLI